MTVIEIANLSNYIQWFGSFLIFSFAFFSFKEQPIEVLIIGYYGLLSFLFQVLQQISGIYFTHQYNNHIGNVYTLFEIGILLYLYFRVFKRKTIRLSIVIIAFSYLMLFITVIASQINLLNSTAQTSRDVVLIAYAVLYFFFLIIDLPESNLQKLPMFWVNSAILFFFSCTFILSLSINYIREVLSDDFLLYWAFRNFLRTLFCLIICWGIWQARKQQIAARTERG